MFRQIGTALSALLLCGAPADADGTLPPGAIEDIAGELQAGDLVFKGASTAVWTQLAARWSTGDKRWGHVGIVTKVPDTCCGPILVVHADTGTGDPNREAAPGEVIGEVRVVPLNEFLSDVDQAGLYRLDLDRGQRARMIAYAEAAAAAHTPFDRGYSIDSENNLYCTELVWRALSAALERDAIPEKSRSMGRIYIALSDLSLHPLAREVLNVGAPG